MKTETSSQLAYHKFIEQVKAAQVQRVAIKPDRIDYTLKPEFGSHPYYTRPTEPIANLTSLLQSHGVEFVTLPNQFDTAGVLALLLSSGGVAEREYEIEAV